MKRSDFARGGLKGVEQTLEDIGRTLSEALGGCENLPGCPARKCSADPNGLPKCNHCKVMTKHRSLVNAIQKTGETDRHDSVYGENNEPS